MALKIHHESQCEGLLVHDFTNPLARWKRSEHQVLSEGFRLAALSVLHSPEWFTANLKTTVEMKPHEITFVYNKPPPTITSDRIFSICKEWGSQISDDELVTLDDLSEFDTKPTNEATGQVSCDLSQQNRGTQSNAANEADVIDNRKINIDPIHQIIPQPHLFPSPFMNSVSPKLKDQIFNKKEPTFLDPHSEFPGINYARAAWLVPIRGKFPWNESSSGVLLHSEVPSLVEGHNAIHWNSASLLKFWSFLLDLRKAGSLGSLGVSLHSARRQVEIRSTALSPNLPSHHRVLMQSSLSTVDYIKVYHDGSASLHVRRALDSWSYQHGSTEGKLRLLKGATLPLVDEVSSGILLL